MLEEEKSLGSPQKDPAGASPPKMSRISNGSQNLAASKNNHTSKSSSITPAQRFPLLLEHCAPSPALGHLTNPLLGGLSGNLLLFGQQAASLRLAQLKSQLALAQIYNALGNSRTRAPYIPPTPPSPTAAAINLLNLLKIANSMTRHLYNPYASPQHQYGLCSMVEREPQRASYPISSSSLGQSALESGGSSLDWSSNYRTPTVDDSKFYSSSASCNDPTRGEGTFNAAGNRESYMKSSPGFGDYDHLESDKPAASSESSPRKYTSESASDLLLHFGLKKEDMEHLTSYPEDKITPSNLPFILNQIHSKKAKRTAVQPKPHPRPRPTRTMMGRNNRSLRTSGGSRKHQDEMSSTIQSSKVIDYGHTGKYTGGFGNEIRKTSKGRSNSGTRSGTSVSTLSSSYSSVLNSVTPPYHDQTKRLQTQATLTAQTISLPKKDTDMRFLKSEALKLEPETGGQSALKTMAPCILVRSVTPHRPGLVAIGRNDGGSLNYAQTQRHRSTATKQMKKQMKQEMMKKPVSQTGQVMWPPGSSCAKPVPSALLLPSITDTSQGMQHMSVSAPALPQLIPSMMTINRSMSGSNKQPPEMASSPKVVPALAMMQDYAAASPRIFPHTCCLCNKECTYMEDWISHQNTSLHLESCRLLQQRYPDWDGEIKCSRAQGKDAKHSSLTTSYSSQHHQKAGGRSCSRSGSSSPQRFSGSEGRRKKYSRRSQSPSRHGYRSNSPWFDRSTYSHYWSCSKSPERQLSPKKKDEIWSPPRRGCERLSPPWWGKETPLPPRWSDGRLSPPGWIDGRQSPPGWSSERQSPPSWTTERQSPPRWSSKRRSEARSDERRLSTRSDETRSPPVWSNGRLLSPRMWDTRQLTPRTSIARQSPLTWSNKRPFSRTCGIREQGGTRRWDRRQSSPSWNDEQLSQLSWSKRRPSPPGRDRKRQLQPRSHESRSLTGSSSPQGKGSRSAETLVKNLGRSDMRKHEFVEEEEENMAERNMLKECQEDKSVDSIKQETLVTLHEAGGDEDDKQEEEPTKRTSGSAQHEHDGDGETLLEA